MLNVRTIRVNTCYFKIPAFQLTSVNKKQADIMILVKDQGQVRKVRVFSTLNEKRKTPKLYIPKANRQQSFTHCGVHFTF